MRTIACERIGYLVTNPTSAGLYRFLGDALVNGTARTWSVVLKVLQPWTDEALARWAPDQTERIREVNQWDREAAAYASGALSGLGGGLSAPRLLALDRTGSAAWLWLEDVREDIPAWDVGRYALAARQLGRFNGASAGRLLDWPWLSQGWLRAWTERTSRLSLAILEDDAAWRQPAVREALGDDARRLLRTIVAEHPERLALLDGLTQCVAHLDAYRGNLLARRDETVVLDWSFVGVGALGAEASQLVCGSVFYSFDRQDVADLSAAVFDAYLDGLREAGWHGAADEVRRGYLASTLVRWSTIGLAGIRAAGDPEGRAGLAARLGIGYEDWLALAGRRIAYLRECRSQLEPLSLPRTRG